MRSALVTSKDATPTISLHKSRCDRLYVCVSNLTGVLNREQYGELCVFASAFCRYDLRKSDLFVRVVPGGATSLSR